MLLPRLEGGWGWRDGWAQGSVGCATKKEKWVELRWAGLRIVGTVALKRPD